MSYLCIILGLAALSAVYGCQVQKLGVSIGTPLSRLYAGVRHAEEQIRDGVIDLSAVAPEPSEPQSTRDIRRPRVGETVNFTCDPRSSESNVASSIIWRHYGSTPPTTYQTTIFTNSTPPSTSGSFFYSLGKVNNIHYLFIHNVSLSSVGNVQCLQECMENGVTALCTRKEYVIRPKLTVADVFVDIMQNVSTRYWSFDFHCKAWVRVPNAWPHFIWTYDNVFINTPKGHFMGGLFGAQPYPNGLESFKMKDSSKCHNHQQDKNAYCHITMAFTTCKSANIGRTAVECWVQPDPSVEEYFVQKAYVEFH